MWSIISGDPEGMSLGTPLLPALVNARLCPEPTLEVSLWLQRTWLMPRTALWNSEESDIQTCVANWGQRGLKYFNFRFSLPKFFQHNLEWYLVAYFLEKNCQM